MPREIIDTASSRPAYIRRRIIRTILLLIVAIIVIAAGVALERRMYEHPSLQRTSAPGNSGRQGNLAPIPQSRRAHAA